MSTIDLAASPGALRVLAEQSNAWPFEQAKAIVERLKKQPKDEVLFETGYGPSGLPHIGTFGEVARTTMVRHAFRVLTEDRIRTRLIAFSDDMDGLRKVPDNVPNKEMLADHLGKPLTRVPDPFGTHASFGAHNNARLRAFLDTFGFDYEFASSTDYYRSGKFDADAAARAGTLDAVMAIMLPSLREERAASYSPFLPICPRTGVVLYVPIVEHDVKAGTVSYDDPGNKRARHAAGHRRPLQAAVEAGLGDALVRARGRLRDGRQGSDRFRQTVGQDLLGAGRHAAGSVHLRAVPRRAGPENIQVERQWTHHRRVAALRFAGIAVAVHVSRAEVGEAAVFRRDPAPCRRLPAVPGSLSAAGSRSCNWQIRSGISTPAIRRRPTCPSPSSCC